MNRFRKLIGFLLVWTIIFLAFSIYIHSTLPVVESFFEQHNLDERREGYFMVKNEEDERIILVTARVLHVGDEYIDADNVNYRIVRITDDIAWARQLEVKKGLSLPIRLTGHGIHGTEEEDNFREEDVAPVESRHPKKIAVYHSHGAESYVPSDGKSSIDRGGGIIDVGRSFCRGLEDRRINVIHSTQTHIPHDAGAYHRSRRTMEEMIKDQPMAFFDIHRDAVPAKEYIEQVAGKNRVQLLLVLGRQNQNVDNNARFAEALKGEADRKYPGLVKGILKAQGNYNQDLSPRSILLEIGGHENQREGAEETARLFAGVVADYFESARGGEGEVAGQRNTVLGEGGISAVSALRFLVIVLLGAFVFLLISAGSWDEAMNRLRRFLSREFADLRGREKE